MPVDFESVNAKSPSLKTSKIPAVARFSLPYGRLQRSFPAEKYIPNSSYRCGLVLLPYSRQAVSTSVLKI